MGVPGIVMMCHADNNTFQHIQEPHVDVASMQRVSSVSEESQKSVAEPSTTVDCFHKLLKKTKKRTFIEMANCPTFVERTSQNLIANLSPNGGETITKMEMRPICEKVIKKAAGVGWKFLSWKFVHKQCDKIATTADKNNDDAIELLEFQIFLRGTLLYLGGALGEKGCQKLSDYTWRNQKMDYTIIKV